MREKFPIAVPNPYSLLGTTAASTLLCSFSNLEWATKGLFILQEEFPWLVRQIDLSANLFPNYSTSCSSNFSARYAIKGVGLGFVPSVQWELPIPKYYMEGDPIGVAWRILTIVLLISYAVFVRQCVKRTNDLPNVALNCILQGVLATTEDAEVRIQMILLFLLPQRVSRIRIQLYLWDRCFYRLLFCKLSPSDRKQWQINQLQKQYPIIPEDGSFPPKSKQAIMQLLQVQNHELQEELKHFATVAFRLAESDADLLPVLSLFFDQFEG